MTQERQDGWYWVKWPHWDNFEQSAGPGPWRVALYDSANNEWINQGLHRRHPPTEIGPRILSPDEPKDPDLLAVVAAANEWARTRYHAGNTSRLLAESIEHAKAEAALREALANLKEG